MVIILSFISYMEFKIFHKKVQKLKKIILQVIYII